MRYGREIEIERESIDIDEGKERQDMQEKEAKLNEQEFFLYKT